MLKHSITSIQYLVRRPGPSGHQMMSRGRILDSIRKHLENVLSGGRREALDVNAAHQDGRNVS